MSGDSFPPRYSVIADTRRRFSEAEKAAIVAETLEPRANVSAIARRHGVKAGLLFRWRRLAREGGHAQPVEPAFLPVSVTAPTKNCDAAINKAPTADSRIEIELANGRRVRVGSGADMGALQRILDLLERR